MSVGGGSQDEEVTEKIMLMSGALMIIPALIPKVREAVSAWLLEHHVLVNSSEALLPVPLTDGGLDLRRLVIIALLVVAIVWTYLAAGPRARKGATRG
ncbi:MAG: hypothetical protein L0H31_17145 [Nocardioidaceae bacterium]|nr:hypothetical protein [Nocardioidaceae bacterium]